MNDLEQIERLLAAVRRCERFARLEPDPAAPTQELVRVVAELRIRLGATPAYRGLESTLAQPTVERLRHALAQIGERLVADQQQRLRPSAA